MLETLGCRTTVAEDGFAAIEALETARFDLILMDCQMPRMDGFTATGKIREREEHADTRLPIIALTANVMAGDKERCLAAGMDDYLSKPLDMDQLGHVLGKYLLKNHDTCERSEVLAITPSQQGHIALNHAALNTEMLDNMRSLQGGEAILARVVDLYLNETPIQLADLRAAVESSDTEKFARIAHKLKSANANIGAEFMAELCSALEAIGRNNISEGAEDLLIQIENELTGVCRTLRAQIPHQAAG